MSASDKLAKLVKYVQGLNDKLTSPPTPKHAANPEGYYNFLRREIRVHQKKIDELRMSDAPKK